ncbi:hypothetical protein [Pseudoxanthomonas putridarboris]|uniref:Uncharacterized protein n=1 Tax=Pseudoxanthomonas putridarboris TaxID=752605 RepID=A0ABU9J1R0_9GAMM
MDKYKGFYWTALASACLGLLAMLGFDNRLKLLLYILGLIGLIMAAWFALGFVVRGSKPGRPWLLLGGLLVIVGGAGFDVCATLIHSPDLSREANPVARTLLASGLNASSVVAIGVLAQVLLVAICCFVWMNFVARLEWYKVEIARDDGRPIATKMLGISGRGWGAILAGKIDPPLFVSGIAPAILAVFAYRTYLALEWFGSVPISRLFVPLMLLAIALLLQWVWCVFWAGRIRGRSVG